MKEEKMNEIRTFVGFYNKEIKIFKRRFYVLYVVFIVGWYLGDFVGFVSFINKYLRYASIDSSSFFCLLEEL